MDSAVTFDLIKAGALIPQSRLSLCFPHDFPTDPLTSTPRSDVDTIKFKQNTDSNENVTLMDISPVNEHKELFTSSTGFNIDGLNNGSEMSFVPFKILKSPVISRPKTPSSTITCNLSPIRESSPLHSTPLTIVNSEIVRKELTFSDNEDIPPTPRLNKKRRRTMSPTELGHRKCKKSPKDGFKTLSSIRRSLRGKTFNSLSRWMSSADVAGKFPSSSPSMAKKPSKVKENTPKKPAPVDDLFHQSPPLRSLGYSTVEEDTHRMQLVHTSFTYLTTIFSNTDQNHWRTLNILLFHEYIV